MNVYIAAIDVGSNAVRMTLGNCQQSAQTEVSLNLIKSWRIFLRLGEDVFQFGHITTSSLEILTDILKRYVNELQNYPNVSIFIAATSAMRAANNRQEALRHVQKHAGIKIKILSGIDEADCMLNTLRNMVAWRSVDAEIKRFLLADLGGGSLEISVVEASLVLYRKSLDYGALRLAKLSSNAQKVALKTLYGEIREIRKYFAEHRINIRFRLVLTGGSAKVMARLIHQRQYPGSPLPSLLTVTWKQFMETRIAVLNQATDHYESSLELRSDQAETFIPALHVFQQLGNIVGCEEISIPFIGLKEGLLLQRAQRIFPQCSLLL